MFKDLYKQANDKINTDAAKNRVMARLSQGSLPARKSYGVAKVAVLAACFILTIAAAGIYENIQKESETLPGMTPEMSIVVPSDTDVQDAWDISPAPTAAPKEPVAKSTPSPVRKKIAPETKNEAYSEALSVDTAPASEYSIARDTSAPEEIMASGGGSSAKPNSSLVINTISSESFGTAAARLAMPQTEEIAVSVEEYCQYLGKNIPTEVVLPAGVENETAPEQNLAINEDGEFAEDDYTFRFSGEEKLIQVETTKNTEKVLDVIENPQYEKSTIGDETAVVLGENDILKAYMAVRGVGYTITTIGCTESELETLLVSLN